MTDARIHVRKRRSVSFTELPEVVPYDGRKDPREQKRDIAGVSDCTATPPKSPLPLEGLRPPAADARSFDVRAKPPAHPVRNRAFVFIKPHALTDRVRALVRDFLASKEVQVVKEGTIHASAIERGMLLDNHYYAIATNATMLTPDKHHMRETIFKEKFGLDWADVLRNGTALNARDACERFRVDGQTLGAMWETARMKGDFIKLGSGIYCAKLVNAAVGEVFVLNGFFMEMRAKYLKPGAAIHYYLAEWSPWDLSWATFRKLLGATDPSAAPRDSLRGTIFAKWQDLGLPAEPNISDNGVHGSASPIEALFERMNWLGFSMQEDPYGATLLQHDITPELIEEWRRNPQISYGHGNAKTTGSLYNALADLDVDRCTTMCQDFALTGHTHATVRKNEAFVLVKPHAVTNQVKCMIRQMFEERYIRIKQEGFIEADQIDQEMLVDRHYYAIASKATLLTSDKLLVPKDRFRAKFGVEWVDVLAEGCAFNAKDACAKFGLSSADLAREWNIAKQAGRWVKFGGGFYCARIDLSGQPPFYVFNGFFMEMRDSFVKQGAEVHYFLVQWDPVRLSWADFRGEVLGCTDPALADSKSIRGRIFGEWQDLGLRGQPNITDNGVHASASPIEALFERMNWLGSRLERDSLGKALLQAGVSHEKVDEWSKDPQILHGLGSTRGSFYDYLENTDTDNCLDQCLVISRVGHTPVVVRNSALVFIKPHALTGKTKDLVRDYFSQACLKVVSEGHVLGETIEQYSLIDNHCHALASKSLAPPEELPVPEARFKEHFGIEWKEVLQKGVAVNARQACEKMGIDARGLATRWAQAKSKGDWMKFGGGFYCARIRLIMESETSLSLFVINGFYMDMRAKYVAPGAAIYYFQIEWDPLDLSWSDFRRKALGGTNPAEAPGDSLRGLIFSQWQALGLAAEPDFTDNGVHGSASAFEAMCERMNWLGVKIEEDSFGQLLLHGGITKKQIEAWRMDPQVSFTSRQQTITCRLFDAVENLDSDRCVTRCQLIIGGLAVVAPEEDARDWLNSEQAQDLHRRGKVLGTTSFDTHEGYTFKYFIEDPLNPGPIWEVVREQKHLRDGEYQEPICFGKKLTMAMAQQILKPAALPNPSRSPLANRLPPKPFPRMVLQSAS